MTYEEPIPELIALPVLRPDFFDQSTTDRLLSRLWQEAPEGVRRVSGEENWSWPFNRDYGFRNGCWHAETFFRESEADVLSRVDLDLAVVDLVHELSRRIRKVYHLHEMPPLGKPLADRYDADLPPLVLMPFDEKLDFFWGEMPEMDAGIPDHLYSTEPVLMFTMAEEERLQIKSYGVANKIRAMITELTGTDDLEITGPYERNLRRRIRTMCDHPSYEETLAIMEQMEGPVGYA